jgi:hypothetical protein
MRRENVLRKGTETAELPVNSAENKRNARTRPLLVELLLLGCSILVSLSAGELLLRRYYPIGEINVRFDRRYLYRYIPNSREIYRFSAANGGKQLLVTINGEGRRGDVVSMKRPRIPVYGDSFISSIFTPINQTFVWQLERKLGSTFASAPQVVNCGVSGYGPDQESLVLEDEIDRLKPQMVIVAIYAGNDFGDLLRHKIYKLDDQKQLKDNDYTIDPSLASPFGTSKPFSRFYSLRLLQKAWEHLARRQAPRASWSSEGYLESWLRRCRAEYEEYVINGNNNVWDFVDGHYDADVSLTPNSESSRYKRILMDRVIEKMKRITAARSTPLMLVIIPSAFDVVDNYTVSVDTRKYPEYRRSELTDIVEGIAQKYQIPCVNLYRPFREHGASSLYYVVDNDHWKPEGQQLAAGLVADYIKQHHLLDATTGASGGTRH